MKAVIQCGGKGTRLRPHTSILPKPLMPIGARPVLELVLKWLRRNGIKDVFITTGYLGHLIRSVCGDGNQWNMRITYTQEPEPLGTMGPLSLLCEHLDEPFLVLNGDVLTDLSLSKLMSCHRRHQANSHYRHSYPLHENGVWCDRRDRGARNRFPRKARTASPRKHGHLLHGARSTRTHPLGCSIRLRRFDVPDVGGGSGCARIQAQRHVAGYRPGGGLPKGPRHPMGRAIARVRGNCRCLRQSPNIAALALADQRERLAQV